VRAVLKILGVEFTAGVPTLAVTCDTRPRLLVNLDFVSKHCRTDAEVKALICHEFLHVLLRHTDRLVPVTAADHLALDAVINAIIHRTFGTAGSAMMSRYYAGARSPYCLLRPPTGSEWDTVRTRRVREAWFGLYDGRLVADDIRDLARDLLVDSGRDNGAWLGNHGDVAPVRGDLAPPGHPSLAEETLRAALDTALQSMNGSGVFRSPFGRGVGAAAYRCDVQPADAGVERWRRETYEVLRRHLLPDPTSAAREAIPRDFVLPVLSPADRRAALRALWSPFLPNALWDGAAVERAKSAQVYLDVSGSMSAEMPLIVALLGRLARHVRRPFWAFSTAVAPARIEAGRLVADTTGGTSMTCVLAHVARTRPEAAVVITDGYIEPLEPAAVAGAAATRLHVLVTRDGSPELVRRAGLSYTQLGRLPQ
jgi:hypothetical protein